MIKIFTQTKYTFEGQKENESINIFLYRHWITIIIKLSYLGLLILIPIIPLIVLSGYITKYHFENITFFLMILFYIFIWSNAFFSITMYLLDTWIVTNERVIDMTQHGFFSRAVSEMPLAKVQDISVKVEGFIATIFGYGNVEIQSAGTVDKFVFKQVARPNKVKDEIMELVNKARESESTHSKI